MPNRMELKEEKKMSGATLRMEFKWDRRIYGIEEKKKETPNLCHMRIYYCVDRSIQSWKAIRLHAWTDKLIRVYFHLDFFLLLLCLTYCFCCFVHLLFEFSSVPCSSFAHVRGAMYIALKRRGWRLCYTRAIATYIQLMVEHFAYLKRRPNGMQHRFITRFRNER